MTKKKYFILGKCALSCSSYQCPQLSKEESFKFDHIEVWGVGEEPHDEDDGNLKILTVFCLDNRHFTKYNLGIL